MGMGVDLSLICNRTQIDMFFLDKIKKIVDFERELGACAARSGNAPRG